MFILMGLNLVKSAVLGVVFWLNFSLVLLTLESYKLWVM